MKHVRDHVIILVLSIFLLCLNIRQISKQTIVSFFAIYPPAQRSIPSRIDVHGTKLILPNDVPRKKDAIPYQDRQSSYQAGTVFTLHCSVLSPQLAIPFELLAGF